MTRAALDDSSRHADDDPSTSPIRLVVIGDERARAVLAACAHGRDGPDIVRTELHIEVAPTVADGARLVPAADCVVLWPVADPHESALRDLDALTAMAPGTPVIVVTSETDLAKCEALLDRGAQDVVDEPGLRAGSFLRAVRFAVARSLAINRSTSSQRHYKSVVESLDEAVIVQGVDGTILSVNSRAKAILGASADVGQGLRTADINWFPHDETGRSLGLEEGPGYRCIVTGEPIHNVVLGVVSSDGDEQWLDTSCYPLRNAGQPDAHGIVTVMRDVTAARADQDSLRFHAMLLDAVGQSVIATDLDGRIRYWNRAAEEMFGWSAEEVIGGDIMGGSMLGLDQRADLLDTVASGRPWNGDMWAVHRDGTHFAILVTNTPVRDRHGTVTGIIGVASDISARLAAESASRLLSSIVEASTDAIYGTDLDDLISSWNGGATSLYGYTADEMIGRHVSVLDADDGAADTVDVSPDALSEHILEARDTRQRRRDGTVAEVSVRSSPVYDGHGNVIAKAVIARDVGDRMRLERALSDDRDRLADAQRIGKLGSLDRDSQTGAHVWSAELYRMFGVDPTITPDDATYLAAVHPDDREMFMRAVRVGYRESRPVEIEHRVALPEGVERWVSTHVGATSEGRIVGAVLDITERKRAGEELRHRARHDPLTDLANRGTLETELRDVIESGHCSTGAVMFVDIDRFKIVNDGMGHAAGDELLVALTARLREWARPTDTVARFGGDEFVVLCREGDLTEARIRAEELVTVCAQPFRINRREILVTVSVGLAAIVPGCHADEVLIEADAAMFEAKERGRALVVVADLALRERVVTHLELEMALRQAVANDEFVLHYQPVVDTFTEEILGHEALIRWNRPGHGLVFPDQFIGLAEETGLIIPIGRWVLHEALRQLARWRALASPASPMGPAGTAGPADGRSMSVNLSTLQLYNPDLITEVGDALAATGIDAGLLHLEITETSLMDIDRAAKTLAALSAIGVHIELDDFGTGYSSLSYLQKLPIDTIKIDRSFMAGLCGDGQDSSIVASIVNLGISLGMTVLAEGVETVGQRDELRRLGCHKAQGYFWSRPLPADPEVVSSPGFTACR